MTRVRTGARLHFGLLHVPSGGEPTGPSRRFGGVGLMLESPAVVVDAARAARFEAAGPVPEAVRERARQFAERAVAHLPAECRSPVRVVVGACPPEHAGLGVGTQLGLAVARAVELELAGTESAAAALAGWVGRGERSAVGVHGFAAGGLIVEGGRLADGGLGPLLVRADFPDWPVLLIRPTAPAPAVWSGAAERAAFARPREGSAADRLCRVLLLELLPALQGRDYPAFAEALAAYNRLAGEPFARDQGGPYCSAAVAAAVAAARASGAPAAGQSSWGPTAFAVAPDAAALDALRARLEAAFPAGAWALEATRARNRGAEAES